MTPPGEGPKPELTAADALKIAADAKRQNDLQKAQQEMKDTDPSSAMIQGLDARLSVENQANEVENITAKEDDKLTPGDIESANTKAIEAINTAYGNALLKFKDATPALTPEEKKVFDDWKTQQLEFIQNNKAWYEKRLNLIEEDRKKKNIEVAEKTLASALDALADDKIIFDKASADAEKNPSGNFYKNVKLGDASFAIPTLSTNKKAADVAAENLQIDAENIADAEKALAAAKNAKTPTEQAEADKKAADQKAAADKKVAEEALGKLRDTWNTVKSSVGSFTDTIQETLRKQAEDATLVKTIVTEALEEVDRGVGRDDVSKFIDEYVPVFDGTVTEDEMLSRANTIKNTAKNNPELNARLKLHEDAKNALHNQYVDKNGKVDFEGNKEAQANTTLGDLFPDAKAITINGALAVKQGVEFVYADGTKMQGQRAKVKDGDVLAVTNAPTVTQESRQSEIDAGRLDANGQPVDGRTWVENDEQSTNYATVWKLESEAMTRELLPQMKALGKAFLDTPYYPEDSDSLAVVTEKRANMLRGYYQIERRFQALGKYEQGAPQESINIFDSVKHEKEENLPLLDKKIAELTKAEEDKKKPEEKPKAASEDLAKKEQEIQDLGNAYETARAAALQSPHDASKTAAARDASNKLLTAQLDLAKMKSGTTTGVTETAAADQAPTGKDKPTDGKGARGKKKVEKKEEEENTDVAALTQEATVKFEKQLSIFKSALDNATIGADSPDLTQIGAYNRMRDAAYALNGAFKDYHQKVPEGSLETSLGKLDYKTLTIVELAQKTGQESKLDQLESFVRRGASAFLEKQKNADFVNTSDEARHNLKWTLKYAQAFQATGLLDSSKKTAMTEIVQQLQTALNSTTPVEVASGSDT